MSYKHVRSWRERTKARMIEAMGGKCVCCGYKKENSALEFHHLDRKTKKFSFGHVKKNCWPSIVEELRKCVLLCANCHREVERGITTIPEKCCVFNEEYSEYRTVGRPLVVCIVCGACFPQKHKNHILCSQKCYRLSSRKVKERPSKSEVIFLSEKIGFEAIGRMYGVSGNAVRKWIK